MRYRCVGSGLSDFAMLMALYRDLLAMQTA